MSGRKAREARRKAEERKQSRFMALLRNKATMGVFVAGVTVASGLYLYLRTSGIDAAPPEFYVWNKHVAKDSIISKNNPGLVSEIATEGKAYKSHGPVQRGNGVGEPWTIYSNFDKDALLDLTSQNFQCTMVANTASGYIEHSRPGLSTDQKRIEKDSFNLALELLKDTGYNENIINGANIDCKAISTTYLAAYVAEASHLDTPVEIELDSGVAFSKAMMGNQGDGHQWIQVNGDIIDAAMYPEKGFRTNPHELSYAPIVGIRFTIQGHKVSGNTVVYCYPSTIEAGYSNSGSK